MTPPPSPHLPGQAVGLGSVVAEVADLAVDDVHAADPAGVLGVTLTLLVLVGDDLADAAAK